MPAAGTAVVSLFLENNFLFRLEKFSVPLVREFGSKGPEALGL